MKLRLNPDITFQTLEQTLKKKLPQYSIILRKNPVTRFDYLEVKKSGTVGVWIRIFEKKQQVWLITCMPSAFARAMLGILFIFIFLGAQNRLKAEVGEVIKQSFTTDEV